MMRMHQSYKNKTTEPFVLDLSEVQELEDLWNFLDQFPAVSDVEHAENVILFEISMFSHNFLSSNWKTFLNL